METDVLVVGAGPAGLATAVELGMRGVRVLVTERNDRVGYAPRAKTTNVRTRAHFRRWGIAGQLAAASPLGLDHPYDVIFVTRLAGYQLAHMRNAFNAAPTRDPRYPEHAQWIPQYTLERVLRDHLATVPTVEMHFNTTYRKSEAEGADWVCSKLIDAQGRALEVRSRFVVGADGARSAVREALGIPMRGSYGLSRNYNVVFHAPGLAEANPHGPGTMFWQVNADGASLIGPIDSGDLWYFMPTGMKEGETLTNTEAAAAIAKATGIDLAYEILSTDEWVASRLLADRYRQGRILLAGDACHLHPPFGGYGMNMGIGDAVDLGWKIAAVLQGWGGPALIDSYEAERRPVHEQILDEATSNHAVLGNQLWREGLEDATLVGEQLRREVGERILATKAREFFTLGTVLGMCYAPSPLIADDGTEPVIQRGQDFRPTGRPGCLAPHAWLSDGSSLYDLFGPGFSLVVEDGHTTEIALALADAEASQIPLTIVNRAELRIQELFGAPLSLIRPDQHVAWRGDRWMSGVLRLAAGFALAPAAP